MMVSVCFDKCLTNGDYIAEQILTETRLIRCVARVDYRYSVIGTCPPKSWLQVETIGRLQDGSYSVEIDGKALSTSGSRSISSGARHVLKLRADGNDGKNATSEFNGVLLGYGGGKLLSEAFRSDLILKLEGYEIPLDEQCSATTTENEITLAFYSLSGSQTQMTWSFSVPYRIRGLLLTVSVARNNSQGTPKHHVSTFVLDVGDTSDSQRKWLIMWELLLGLGTIGVAIKFVLLRTREREQDYGLLQSEYGDEYVSSAHGTQVEFVPLA